jgi:NAD(P)H-hydrate epimerase
MPGAAQLAVHAALRAGVGLVTLGVFQRELIAIVSSAVPEATYLDLSRSKYLFTARLPREIEDHQHDVRVVGPGLGQGGQTRELVRCLLSCVFEGPLVVDADALNVVGEASEVLSEHVGPVVITPHPGEAERLLGRSIPDDDEGRSDCARELAQRTGAVCAIKGRHTVIAYGERLHVNQTGNPGMATAGSGDVLCGILGAYLARAVRVGEVDPFEVACAAVHVHGLAGDLAAETLGRRALMASDLIAHLPAAQQSLE